MVSYAGCTGEGAAVSTPPDRREREEKGRKRKDGRRERERATERTATSTMSAAIKLMPSNPRRIVRSSRVDHPPVSGVPVAGATGTTDCVSDGSVFLTLRPQGRREGKRKLTGRIQSVDVERQVHWVLGADAVADLLDNFNVKESVIAYHEFLFGRTGYESKRRHSSLLSRIIPKGHEKTV